MANQLTFSITPDSLKQLPEASVAVCAHDAGAASHMVAWLAPLQEKLRLCLAGPAVKSFNTKIGNYSCINYNLDRVLDGARVLISGTGWESDLEHRARQLARQRGIPSVAVLDHWVNYRERFQRNGQYVLPDQFWVADSDAANLARAAFPDKPIQQLPNHWLDDLCSTVQAIRSSNDYHPRKPARRLLYLLEPIRVNWTLVDEEMSEAGEFQALRYWLKKLQHLSDLGWVDTPQELEALVLRPHPSEPSGKYDLLIDEASHCWPIRLDNSRGLAEALAWADVVFGCETQALVAAIACNLPAFSTVPPWAVRSRLPQASLHHLSLLEVP